MNDLLSIELLDWAQARVLAQPIRTVVFVDEQRVPAEMEWDEWDDRSVHAVARSADRLVGTGRLLPLQGDGTIRIGRMAVLKEFRRHGAGAAILQALLTRARGLGAREAVLHAQTYVTGFYRRHGFRERGDLFFEAGIAHVEMTLTLTGEPGRGDAAQR